MARKRRKRAHGQGCVYERGPNNWWIKWREYGRVRYSGAYETRELADEVRAKIVADIAAGRAGLPEAVAPPSLLSTLADDWLERRKRTHRAAGDDVSRWTKHLKPFLGSLTPAEVDGAMLRRYVEAKLASGLNPATVGHTVRLLSTFFTDLVENHHAASNPVRALPRSTRRLYRPTSDPKSTPFIEKLSDVRRLFLALPDPVKIAFAIGAFGGLRTGEVLGLDWRDIDLSTGRIHVQRQVQEGTVSILKDEESRMVPIQSALLPILKRFQLRTGGSGKLFGPQHERRGGRPGSPPLYMRGATLRRHLKIAFATCKLVNMKWYEATRHTFASQWVLHDGSIEKLATVLGHSSTVVTERYAHLRPDLFGARDRDLLNVDLSSEPKAPSTLAAPRRRARIA